MSGIKRKSQKKLVRNDEEEAKAPAEASLQVSDEMPERKSQPRRKRRRIDDDEGEMQQLQPPPQRVRVT